MTRRTSRDSGTQFFLAFCSLGLEVPWDYIRIILGLYWGYIGGMLRLNFGLTGGPCLADLNGASAVAAAASGAVGLAG